MRDFDAFAHVAAMALVVVIAIVLFAYHADSVRDAVRRVFAVIQLLFDEVSTLLRGCADNVKRVLPQVRRQFTHDDRFPLPFLAVGVAVLAPLLILVVLIEVRLWGAYFENLFPERVALPLVGTVPGGLLTALMPVAAGFLLGWLVEAAFGVLPLPVFGGLADSASRPRPRAFIGLVLVMMWALLVMTVYNAANEVYDGLGESTCALQSTSVSGGSNLVSLDTMDATAAQAACVADWKANDRARAIRVILSELTLHLSGLFAWVILTAVGLVLLLALGLLVVALGIATWLATLAGRLVTMGQDLAQVLLQLLARLAALLVQVLAWVGLPLPSPPAVGDRGLRTLVAGHSFDDHRPSSAALNDSTDGVAV